MDNFNSRPSARGDLLLASFLLLLHLFQFTPLREGRHRGRLREGKMVISIHAPPRGATKVIGEDPGDVVFQFTPLREGRRRRRKNVRIP